MVVASAGTAERQASAADPGYHRCWYPVALSTELDKGVQGRDFLGSRIVLYRDPAGRAVVQGAWCPHLGADLSQGVLADGRLRCPYHHWSFDAAGKCAHIASGDKIPPGARVATYPSAEAWGLVWAFHGEIPLYDLPRLPGATEAELDFEAHCRGERQFDPWVAVSNGVDFQHLRALHGIPATAMPESVTVEDYAIEYRVEQPGFAQHGRITGTNVFAQHLRISDGHIFMLFSSAPMAHGRSMGYYVFGVPKAGGAMRAAMPLAALHQFVNKLNDEDAPVLSGMRFRKGLLTASDRHLARYLKYVERYPTALPPD